VTTSEPWTAPEQGEDEDYVDFLGRKSDFYEQNPPPAPPGFELIECDATPRHWPKYQHADDDFYHPPCPDCVAASYRDEAAELKRRYHRLRHPLRGRLASRIIGKLSALGVVSGYGTQFGGESGCNWCVTGIRFRGSRSYILGWPTRKWACLLQQRHWPGEGPIFGMCGKCVPCPDCGTTKLEHECTV
jgi:hypothetical protein